MGCSLVAYFVHVHERFTAKRIRWTLRANLLLVIALVQLVAGLTFNLKRDTFAVMTSVGRGG